MSREEIQDETLLTTSNAQVGSGWGLWLCLTHFSTEWLDSMVPSATISKIGVAMKQRRDASRESPRSSSHWTRRVSVPWLVCTVGYLFIYSAFLKQPFLLSCWCMSCSCRRRLVILKGNLYLHFSQPLASSSCQAYECEMPLITTMS